MVSNPTYPTEGTVINGKAIRLLKKFLHESDCPTLSSVRRNLFGISTKESNNQEFDEQLSYMAKKSSEEWNFDFLNELPLTGRYVWQRVHAYDVPLWYAEVSKSTKSKSRMLKDEESFDLEYCAASTDYETINRSNETENSEKIISTRSTKRPRLVQTSMKDFTRVQKRRSSCRLQLKKLELPSMRKHSHYWMRSESAMRQF